ncbi:MAG: ribosome biogenesis GTPase YlqF, partial [Thermostichus sp. DRC_bins_24]
MSSPAIQWYPGHIAKAIGQLRDQLQRVDVVIEVLDARIPLASRHPELGGWLGEKPRLLALNKVDCIEARDLKAWQDWFLRQGLPGDGGQGVPVYPTNGQSGEGVNRLKQAVLQLGQSVNARRQQRGMRPRAIRAVVVGFPNVGKSALLNRLLGRRVADSAARPGVTRQLRWVRLGGELDLLDSPGIIPPSLPDQQAA